MNKLLSHRKTRIPPLKDDKILTSWNGLMITGLAAGAQVLGNHKALEAAQKSARFILSSLYKDGTLYRRYRDGDVRYEGGLEDYAFMIQALLDLYESDFDESWISIAIQLQNKADELFWDSNLGGYYSSLKDPTLLTRMKEVYDGAIPSGNSIMALNLQRLHAFTSDHQYTKRAEKLLSAFSGFVSQNPQATPAFLIALDWGTDNIKEIAILSKKTDPKLETELKKLHQEFCPNKIVTHHENPEESQLPLLKDRAHSITSVLLQIFVCENQTCQKPVSNIDEILPILKSTQRFSMTS